MATQKCTSPAQVVNANGESQRTKQQDGKCRVALNERCSLNFYCREMVGYAAENCCTIVLTAGRTDPRCGRQASVKAAKEPLTDVGREKVQRWYMGTTD